MGAMRRISMKFLAHRWIGDKVSAVDRDRVRINNSIRINQPTIEKGRKEQSVTRLRSSCGTLLTVLWESRA